MRFDRLSIILYGVALALAAALPLQNSTTIVLVSETTQPEVYLPNSTLVSMTQMGNQELYQSDYWAYILAQKNNQPQPVIPPENQINRTGNYPDGSFGCLIESRDPDPYGAQKQCIAVCPAVPNSEEGVGPAIFCVGVNYASGPMEGQPIIVPDPVYDGETVQFGKCICEVEIIEVIIKDVVLSLAKIEDLLCEIIWNTVNLVLEIGAIAIPVAGPISAEASALLRAASEFSSKLTNGDDILTGFLDWLNPCGQNDITAEVDKVFELFDPLVVIAGNRGWKTGPGRPKRPDSKGPSPTPTTAPSPGSTASKQTPPMTSMTPSMTSSTSSQMSSSETTMTPSPWLTSTASESNSDPDTELVCGLTKRDRKKGQSKWSYCDAKGTVQITEITTLLFGSMSETVIPSITCSLSWKHACAHYQSVVAYNPQWSKLTCSDYHGTSSNKSDRPFTAVWSKQHAPGWHEPKYRMENMCDLDEWPPAYFLAPYDKQFKKENQWVRLLPYFDNRGAATLWTQFCWKEGLKLDEGIIYEQKNKADGSGSLVGKNGKVTSFALTRISASIKWTPVFSIASYELGDLNLLDDGLDQNPCIPDGLVHDKLYPLLIDDSRVAGGREWKYDYRQPPPQSLIAKASTFNHPARGTA